MQYRTLGRTGLRVSALGFGGMRLPHVEGRLDARTAAAMVEKALESGVNYFDTAHGYHGGESEKFFGDALSARRRDILLATKMPPWNLNSAGDLDRIFSEQLQRLKTDYLDCYLLHSLDKENWSKCLGVGALEWLENKRSQGAIRHIGFSFHDKPDVFRRILNDYGGWEFCQIQHNYLDVDFQAGAEGLRYAASLGLGTIIMEPLLGGLLAAELPEEALAVFNASGRHWSPVEWALRWLWDQPEVGVVLSGMSAPEHVAENCAVADGARAGCLDDAGRETIRRAREAFEKLCPLPCTACRYCMPCPKDVNIPNIFMLYRRSRQFNRAARCRRWYQNHMKPEQKADRCVECRQCEERCPQKIPIAAKLKEAHEFLSRPAE